jgi:hypothetical protein
VSLFIIFCFPGKIKKCQGECVWLKTVPAKSEEEKEKIREQGLPSFVCCGLHDESSLVAMASLFFSFSKSDT